MVILAGLDLENDSDLGKEGVACPKVGARVEPQGPPALASGGQLPQDIVESVDRDLAAVVVGAVGQPSLDAAVVVGLRLESLCRR